MTAPGAARRRLRSRSPQGELRRKALPPCCYLPKRRYQKKQLFNKP
jgi:hypothetical protein